MKAILINAFVAVIIFGFVNADTQITVHFNPPMAPVKVEQLVVGRLQHIQQGSIMRASVTMIEDHGYYMIVDTPSATDLVAKEKMLRGLTALKVYPGQVQLVVTTHGHPDHVGQGNFFPNSRHFFASYEYTGDNYIKTELFSTNVMNVTKNIELWNTPGHTNSDISVIVRNVPCCGTIAVVGDLFYSEADAAGNNTEWVADAWNADIGHVSRGKVICNVNHIVPGHGKIFRVTEAMKTAYKCSYSTNTETTTTRMMPSTLPSVKTNTMMTTTETTTNDYALNLIHNDLFESSIGTTTTPPIASNDANKFVTVDHWQNTIQSFESYTPASITTNLSKIPQETVLSNTMKLQRVKTNSFEPQQTVPSPSRHNVIPVPAENAVSSVPVQSLTNKYASVLPNYHAQYVESNSIFPMFETAATSFGDYLNQHVQTTPCSQIRAVKSVACETEKQPFIDILKMALQRLTNLALKKRVKQINN